MAGYERKIANGGLLQLGGGGGGRVKSGGGGVLGWFR